MWIAVPLTDIRTSDGTRYKDRPYGIIEKLTGSRLKYFIPDEIGATVCKCEDNGEIHDSVN